MVPDSYGFARLLQQRWNISQSDRVEVDIKEDDESISVKIIAESEEFRLFVKTLNAPGDKAARWVQLVDAVDNLVGELESSQRSHRHLPQGNNVRFKRGDYYVEVEKDVPHLSRLADELLRDS